ncbi:MAG: hypothetical protein ACKVP2_05060 [Burkholderiales bacterium]
MSDGSDIFSTTRVVVSAIYGSGNLEQYGENALEKQDFSMAVFSSAFREWEIQVTFSRIDEYIASLTMEQSRGVY